MSNRACRTDGTRVASGTGCTGCARVTSGTCCSIDAAQVKGVGNSARKRACHISNARHDNGTCITVVGCDEALEAVQTRARVRIALNGDRAADYVNGIGVQWRDNLDDAATAATITSKAHIRTATTTT